MRKLAVEQDILDLLRSADGVTTHDVAERLAISISTASKYLEALKREGRVAYTPVGPAKVWRLPEAMPALQDFDHLKRNLTLSSNGAVRLFEERAAIAPAEGLRALHRELERVDPEAARRALYAMGHAMGRHVAGVAAGRTKAVGAELLRASLGYLSLKGWGKHSITAFDPSRP
ncbi:MAG TPA: winged helix-turn-helix domain-containing protein, partial [archaeon]|nr:winged helix-turn-helix domain-containing protein [archaeon]